MTLHSNIVGGSTADRLLACPASWQTTMSLPVTADTPSSYAEEGTFAHEVMAQLMSARMRNEELRVSSLLGTRIYDREFTQDHYDTLIMPALATLVQLERDLGGGFSVKGVEERLAFPGIPGVFGTCDLIMQSDTHLVVLDWKFGQGVPVRVSYRDALGERLNPQIMFYATAAAASARCRRWFGRRQVVVAIVQPRTLEPLHWVAVARSELKDFREDLQRVVVEALSRDPHRERGEHCRWAPCKTICPLWTGPLIELAKLAPVPASEPTSAVTPYAAYLAAAKALVDSAAALQRTIDAQLHAYLSQGGKVPGWKLKLKATRRQWVDDNVVAEALLALGFERGQIFTEELVTFASADATAKRLKVKIPDHLRIAPTTTETTLATEDDPAPPVETGVALDQFRAALAALTKPNGQHQKG